MRLLILAAAITAAALGSANAADPIGIKLDPKDPKTQEKVRGVIFVCQKTGAAQLTCVTKIQTQFYELIVNFGPESAKGIAGLPDRTILKNCLVTKIVPPELKGCTT